jgi:hypothetical protein
VLQSLAGDKRSSLFTLALRNKEKSKKKMFSAPNPPLSGEAQLKYENDRLKLALAQR